MQVEIGIIGGSGLYDMADLTDREEVTLTTPFGDPSGPYLVGTLRGRKVAFLARHGAGHRISPSELTNQQIDPQEGFVLSRINGAWDIQSILSICPFREADCLRMIQKLMERGIVEIK